jgi:hypothetical protein
MLARPRAGHIQQTTFGLLYVVEFCFVGRITNPRIERQHAFIARHQNDRAKLQPRREAH